MNNGPQGFHHRHRVVVLPDVAAEVDADGAALQAVMDELENRGIVGPANGAEPREILMDLDGGGADGRGKAVAGVEA